MQVDVDLAALILRLALGPMLVVHGLNKVRGPGGLAGTARWFEGLRIRPGWLHARIAATLEIGVGVALTSGLATTPACAAVVGLMVVAGFTDHAGKGFLVFKGGWEYVFVVALVALSLCSLGAGRWSLDHVLGWDLSGPAWTGAAGALGLAAAAGLLSTRSPVVPSRTESHTS